MEHRVAKKRVLLKRLAGRGVVCILKARIIMEKWSWGKENGRLRLFSRRHQREKGGAGWPGGHVKGFWRRKRETPKEKNEGGRKVTFS